MKSLSKRPTIEAMLAEVPGETRDLFVRLCFRVVKAGFKHYSARAIFHQMRWHYNMDMGDKDFKINDKWSPTMARWAMGEFPALADFFETRERGEWEDDVQLAAE